MSSSARVRSFSAGVGLLLAVMVPVVTSGPVVADPAPPAAPVVTMVSRAVASLDITATEPGGRAVSYFTVTYAPTSGGVSETLAFEPGAFTPSTGTVRVEQLQDASYTATVTATLGNVGASAPSDPATAAPVEAPSAVRHEANGYLDGVAVVTWDPLASDGRSPITHYDVILKCPKTYRLTVAGTVTTARFRGIPPNQICTVSVSAHNAYSGGFLDDDAELATDVSLVTSLSHSGHARWRLVGGRGGTHPLGGPRFAAAPSVSVDMHGHYYFAGATTKGRLYLRTLRRPWQRLATPRCYRPAIAIVPPDLFDVGCRSATGTFLYTATDFTSRGWLSKTGALDWIDTRRHIIGAVAAAEINLSAEFVVRTAPRGADGHDVSYFDTLDGHWHRMGLSCDGAPAVSGLANNFSWTVACRHSRRSIQWKATGGTLDTHLHKIQTPVRITGAVGVAVFFGGWSTKLAVVGVDHRIRLLDVLQRLWSAGGRTPVPALYLFPYSGSDDFSHIIVV